MNEEALTYLKDTARDTRELLLLIREVVKYMKEAETEVPEKMRRFIMYFHDMHDLRDLYHQAGVEPPKHILREIEKCDDRLKHLLDDLYNEEQAGAFAKVRAEMTARGGNRYDHSRLIGHSTERTNEAGPEQQQDSEQADLPGLRP